MVWVGWVVGWVVGGWVVVGLFGQALEQRHIHTRTAFAAPANNTSENTHARTRAPTSTKCTPVTIRMTKATFMKPYSVRATKAMGVVEMATPGGGGCGGGCGWSSVW